MKHPLVVGNKGEIGRCILNGLLAKMPKALSIVCFDINETQASVISRIKKADVIFLCVPLKDTVSWLIKYKQLLKGKVIFEQASLKEWIYKAIERDEQLSQVDIRSMHILFRPSQTPDLNDRRVGLFKNQFNDIPTVIMPSEIAGIVQAKIVWYDNAQIHDKEMAVQQALLHRTLLCLGEMISKCNGCTYISQKVIELCDRIKKGDKELYSLIQQNVHIERAMNELRYKLAAFNIDDAWSKNLATYKKNASLFLTREKK